MPVKLSGADESGDEARIEIVPLIDIMFFLLASFMMVSLSMTQLNRIPINLPETSTGPTDTKTPPWHITVDAQGVITWDMKVITLSEITERLLKEAAPDETRVMISADAETHHKHVLDVVNAVRAAGIHKVSFETKAVKP